MIRILPILLALVLPVVSHAAQPAPVSPADTDAALIKRGEYLARAGDCMACHTAKHGQPFAGGLPLQTPMGRIYATNITPDRDTGIGTWTYADFSTLMRTGRAKEGYTVYPAMPYPSYSRIGDSDMHALYAYFQHGVAPVHQVNRPSDIPWPLSMRWPLTIWAWLFAPKPEPFSPPLGSQPSITLGRYLVEGLGHCGSCHTARGVALQETALTDDASHRFLDGGGAIDGWIAPSLRGDRPDGIGAWSENDIVAFLKTGRNANTASFGAMNDVIVNSTQHLSDVDLHSIARYLKTLAPHRRDVPYARDETISAALAHQQVASEGAQIYLDRCAGCHRSNGQGAGVAFPALAGNPVLQTADPTSAIHIVLAGGRQPATATAPSAFTMGPLNTVLDDRQVAAVVSFVQTAWGNQGGPATVKQVAKIRADSEAAEGKAPVVAQPQLHHAAPVNRASGPSAGVSGG
ncbi:c-type cytochrome [Burkholderia sp. Ac-20379]|nr:c-type cytochrome [Burkholderia sp. Ac-20379]